MSVAFNPVVCVRRFQIVFCFLYSLSDSNICGKYVDIGTSTPSIYPLSIAIPNIVDVMLFEVDCNENKLV